VSSPEEIAREAALALVRFRDPHDSSPDFGGGNQWAQLVVAGRHVQSDWYTAGQREDLRDAVADAFLAAVQRALASAPVPGGLSEEEFPRILGVMMALDDAAPVDASILLPDQVREVRDALRDVIEDNNHLRRALHDCGQDGTAKVWSSGYEAGRAAALHDFDEAEQASRDLPYDDAVRLIRQRLREGG
jgi:hypothetical protein